MWKVLRDHGDKSASSSFLLAAAAPSAPAGSGDTIEVEGDTLDAAADQPPLTFLSNTASPAEPNGTSKQISLSQVLKTHTSNLPQH